MCFTSEPCEQKPHFERWGGIITRLGAYCQILFRNIAIDSEILVTENNGYLRPLREAGIW